MFFGKPRKLTLCGSSGTISFSTSRSISRACRVFRQAAQPLSGTSDLRLCVRSGPIGSNVRFSATKEALPTFLSRVDTSCER